MLRRNWRVSLPTGQGFTFFSKKPIGRDAALKFVRGTWPQAEIVG